MFCRSGSAWASILPLLAAAVLIGACEHGNRVAIVAPDGSTRATVKIEIADTPQNRELGLMYRDSLAADAGMLFVFPNSSHLVFWMKNTRIPLDILYFDEKYKLISMQQRVPPCHDPGNNCPVYPSNGAAQYVLELNAGIADKLGVKVGDELKVTR